MPRSVAVDVVVSTACDALAAVFILLATQRWFLLSLRGETHEEGAWVTPPPQPSTRHIYIRIVKSFRSLSLSGDSHVLTVALQRP